MDDSKFEKWAALGGVVFVVLAVVGAFIAGSPPKVSDSAVKIVKFTKDNQDSLKIAAYLSGLGVVFLLFFFGVLWSRLRAAEGGSGRLAVTALIAGASAAAVATVGSSISAYGAIYPAESAGTFRLAAVVFALLAFLLVVFTEATSIVIIRTKFLPAWLGWFGGLVALVWLVAGAGGSTDDHTIEIVGLVAFLLWALWMLVLSVMLFRTTDKAPAAA